VTSAFEIIGERRKTAAWTSGVRVRGANAAGYPLDSRMVKYRVGTTITTGGSRSLWAAVQKWCWPVSPTKNTRAHLALSSDTAIRLPAKRVPTNPIRTPYQDSLRVYSLFRFRPLIIDPTRSKTTRDDYVDDAEDSPLKRKLAGVNRAN